MASVTRASLPVVIRLAEDFEQSKLATSPTDFNSPNYERLVGYPQSANKTRGRGTNVGAQKT